MSNYTKATNFATKDTLPTGDSGKIVKGTELDNEFNAIASAVSSKADTASPTFTGTPAAPTATSGSNTTQLATTAYVKGEVDTSAALKADKTTTVTGTGALTGGGDLSANRTIDIATTGVSAATYGSATKIPVIAVNTKGQITSASEATIVPFQWLVTNVSSNTTSYSIPTNAILVLGTVYHYMGSNQGSAVSVNIKNSSGSTLYTYMLTGGNENNGGDGGSGMSSRSAYSIAIPSAAWGGTLEFFRSSGSGSWDNTVNQVVKSA